MDVQQKMARVVEIQKLQKQLEAELKSLFGEGQPTQRKTKIIRNRPAKYTKQGAVDAFLTNYFQRNTGHEVTLTEIESAARNEIGYEGKRQSLNTCVNRFIRGAINGAVIEYVKDKKGVYFVGGFEDSVADVLPPADMASV